MSASTGDFTIDATGVKTMNRPELLAPAGDLEKLEMAYAYGADAAYIGGRVHSLRARASAFDDAAMREAVALARQYGKKLYITLNAVLHPDDFRGLDDYIRNLDAYGVDAFICTSPSVMKRIQKLTGRPIHVSTQQSITNSAAVAFWRKQGVKRVILARETTLEELTVLRAATETPLEVFIHGGMCVSYSGRCALSMNMTGRDGNRGGCAHACRWRYHMEPDDAPFALGAKELNASSYIRELIALGIDSLKIEGRMKSVHYVASVVKSYRTLIDDIVDGRPPDLAAIERELDLATNRAASEHFYRGMPTKDDLLDGRPTPFDPHFLGIVLEHDAETGRTLIEQRNRFARGDVLEVFRHHGEKAFFTVPDMRDEEGCAIEVARHPRQRLEMHVPTPLSRLDIIWRR